MKRFLTVRIDEGLYDFLKRYAKHNHTTLTGLITQYAVRLWKQARTENAAAKNVYAANAPDNEKEI